jgi:hypothetical protein
MIADVALGAVMSLTPKASNVLGQRNASDLFKTVD